MPLLEQVLERYPEKVKVVFKQFPLRNHQFARLAAAASLAAHEQGKFWEFHDRLFRDYNRLNDQHIREIARETGLDMKKFEADLADPRIQALINQDIKDGVEAGVRGTPALYVNGRLLRNRSLEGFAEIIEAKN